MEGQTVQASRVVHAAPAAIFALLADPSQHPRIDGSGALRQVKPGEEGRLALGSTFAMSMKLGIGYSMVNTVIEFEENRRIAWQTRVPGTLGKFIGGRIWRYELEPVDDGTKVTETWDISQDKQRWFLAKGPVADATAKNIDKTLDHLEAAMGPS